MSKAKYDAVQSVKPFLYWTRKIGFAEWDYQRSWRFHSSKKTLLILGIVSLISVESSFGQINDSETASPAYYDASKWYAAWIAKQSTSQTSPTIIPKMQSPSSVGTHWCQHYREIPNAGLPKTAQPLVVYCLDVEGKIEAMLPLKGYAKLPKSLQDVTIHRNIVQQLQKWIPPEQRPWLKSVILMQSSENGAHTAPINHDLHDFMMAIDLTDAIEALSPELIAHEWMHVLNWKSENPKGQPYRQPPYRLAFKSRFWPDGADVTLKRKNEFVSDYAMQSVDEDMAESFAAFVTDSTIFRRKNKKTHEKIQFFYGFPKLVQVKQWFEHILSSTTP